MPKFRVPTQFIFTGWFTVEAESKQEALELVHKNCHLVMGHAIHTSLPDKDVDWNFNIHPDKKMQIPTKL